MHHCPWCLQYHCLAAAYNRTIMGTNTCEELTASVHDPLHIQDVAKENNDKRLPHALSANCLGATTLDGEHSLSDVRAHPHWCPGSKGAGLSARQGPGLGCTHIYQAHGQSRLTLPQWFCTISEGQQCNFSTAAQAPGLEKCSFPLFPAPPQSLLPLTSLPEAAAFPPWQWPYTGVPNLMIDNILLKTCSSGLLPVGEGEERPTLCFLINYVILGLYTFWALALLKTELALLVRTKELIWRIS